MAENDQNPPGEAHFNVFEDDNNPEIPLDEQGDPAASAVPAVPHYVLVPGRSRRGAAAWHEPVRALGHYRNVNNNDFSGAC